VSRGSYNTATATTADWRGTDYALQKCLTISSKRPAAALYIHLQIYIYIYIRFFTVIMFGAIQPLTSITTFDLSKVASTCIDIIYNVALVCAY
jgi:hypothetical protein